MRPVKTLLFLTRHKLIRALIGIVTVEIQGNEFKNHYKENAVRPGICLDIVGKRLCYNLNSRWLRE